MSRMDDSSFYVADSDEEESYTGSKSTFLTPASKSVMRSDPRVILDSDSDSKMEESEEFESANSNKTETDSGTVDSEEEDMAFMNASHRVSIVISSEDESNDSSPEVKSKRTLNLKRRSIYENPVSPCTPGNESTPVDRKLKKKPKRAVPILYSDSEDVSVNSSKMLGANQESISIDSESDERKNEDEVEEQSELEKSLNAFLHLSSDKENEESHNRKLSNRKGNLKKSIQNHSDEKNDRTYFDEKMEEGSSEEEQKLINNQRDSHRSSIRTPNASLSGSVKKQGLNFENLRRHSSVRRKKTQQPRFADLLDESSDSSVNRSRAASISSNASNPTKKSLFQGDKVVDLTIDQYQNSHKINLTNDQYKSSKKVDLANNQYKSSGKIENSEEDIIISSSTNTSESELDQDVLIYAKKEIGVGNIDPIQAQKKEIILLKIDQVQKDLDNLNKFTKTLDMEKLPDKGKKVQENIINLENELEILNNKLKKLERKSIIKPKGSWTPKVKIDSTAASPKEPLNRTRADRKNNKSVKDEFPKAFDDFNIPMVPQSDFDVRELGKRAMATLNQQQSLTHQRLEQLHGSLNSRPTEDQRAEDPKGLKIPLMGHQQHALAWMMWRENQKPKGGILADDMGLGKTLTMISLVLATVDDVRQNKNSSSDESSSDDEWYSRNSRKRCYGGTLVVCPASLINQWEAEVTKRVKRGLLSVLVFHGNNRQTDDRRLSKYNIVVTTYQTLVREQEKDTNFYKMEWNRVILDEAHVIRNHKSKASLAACGLSAKRRWTLTGTPIQNKEADLYAILKFLQCSPFDDLQVWKRWVENKSEAGKQRLITLMKTLMLRRTKQELQAKGFLDTLPEKFFETIEIDLDCEENLVYQKILLFSQNLFAQFLAQRAEKNHVKELYGGKFDRPSALGATTQFTKAQKMMLNYHSSKFSQQVDSHDILVLLLRLRQMCCHPALIHKMLERVDAELNGIDQEDMDEEILQHLQNMSLQEEDGEVDEHAADYKIDSKVASNLLTKRNPVFNDDRRSSKVRAVLDKLKEIVATGEKVIVVSQWTQFLKIIARNLVDIEDVQYKLFTGEIAIKDRQAIVDEFNDPRSGLDILFLSLTAGGVGLNLVGANHLLLIDLHWNPQLECQAQDRIYRFGQKKNVYIYKFICKDTIEEKIKRLQQSKLECAEYVLTGTRSVSTKLTLDDLKLLFS